MKKTIFGLLAAVIFATAFAACATGPSQSDRQAMINAGRLVWEGGLYEDRFYDFEDRSTTLTQANAKDAAEYARGFADAYEIRGQYKGPSIPEGEPSEKDIDKAIEYYEKALELYPSVESVNWLLPSMLERAEQGRARKSIFIGSQNR